MAHNIARETTMRARRERRRTEAARGGGGGGGNDFVTDGESPAEHLAPYYGA